MLRTAPRGFEERVENPGDPDLAVFSTRASPAKPALVFYVRAGESASVQGIRGSFFIDLTDGKRWDGSKRRFTQDCTFQKAAGRFDDSRPRKRSTPLEDVDPF